MTDVLTLRYRPTDWKFVIGQDAIVRSLRSVLTKGSNKTFLLSGPSGVGKTTLARIAAGKIGCESGAIQEINAATFTGIDDMRHIIQSLQYRPLGSGQSRAIILDECHRLSAAAFASLLKSLEEPPAWVWWFLCTTDLGKVPTNIQTRCTRYDLKPVSKSGLRELLEGVVEEEKLSLGSNDEDHDAIVDLCAGEARGSPRTALVNLGACISAKSKDEARSLLQLVGESSKAVDLARALVGNPSWLTIREILEGLKEENPESVRHVVRAYMTNVILGSKKGPIENHLAVLEAFSRPFVATDGIGPLVLACGQLLFGDNR